MSLSLHIKEHAELGIPGGILTSVAYDGSNRATSWIISGVTYTATGWGTSTITITGSNGSSRVLTLDGSSRILSLV